MTPLTWRKIYDAKLPVIEVNKQVIHDKSFEIVKTKYNTEILNPKDTPSLVINNTELWEISFDFMDDCKLVIKKNGEVINNTKSNIQKALSYTDLCGSEAENTLFRSVSYYTGETTSSSIMWEIFRNRFLEIFYNTYGNLNVIKNIPVNVMDADKKSPYEILGLNRPVWRELVNVNEEVGACVNKYFNLIKKLDDENKNRPDYTVSILKNVPELGVKCFEDYLYLVNKGYDYKRLFTYLTDDIYTYQGISEIRDGLQLLKDYVNMCETMGVPYEKYPKSLKLVHDLAAKNLEIKVSEEQQELFDTVVSNQEYADLEYKGTYYSVVKPQKTDDIVNEGRYLHHCVGSYVNTVIKGATKILFFRNMVFYDSTKEDKIDVQIKQRWMRF